MPSSLPSPDFDPAAAYPEVTPLREALQRHDWPAVRDIVAGVDAVGRSLLVQQGQIHNLGTGDSGDDPKLERFLRDVVAQEPDDTLAAAMLGYRLISVGWEIRTANRASNVSREQFATFHDYLRRAEQVLIDAAARNPADPAVWVSRLVSARGLELGRSEVRRRYDRLARHEPHHLPGQAQLLQSLCPKWSGTWELVHDFARTCMVEAPPGSHNAVLVLHGHLERWLDLDGSADEAYLRSDAVQAEIREAAERSVWHPDFAHTFGWVDVRSYFAALFSLLGDETAAAREFAALGDLAARHPWDYLGDPAEELVKRRRRALRKGGAR